MQLTPHIEALQNDLAQLAELGDEATAEAARRLAVALRANLGLRLLDLLTEASMEISAQLRSGHVEVRVAGQEPQLVLVEEESAAPDVAGDEAATARITLRLPEGLKAGVEAAAAREGLSVNAWLVRALSRSVAGTGTTGQSSRGPGSRLSGWARS